MKIRIQGNSIRVRLSKSEVLQLGQTGLIQESTSFGNSLFEYAVKKNSDHDELHADYVQNKITLYVPTHFVEHWATNDVVGLSSKMLIEGEQELKLLIEKDFKCLDNPLEDQSDNYENPKTTC